MRQTIEADWPGDSFAQFGGHVLERLFEMKAELAHLGDKRFRVRVTIEIDPYTPAAGERDAVTVTEEREGVGDRG